MTEDNIKEVPWAGIRIGEECTGAEILMRALYQESVRTIFGYPGVAIMPVYDALYTYTRKRDPWFRHVLVRHEQDISASCVQCPLPLPPRLVLLEFGAPGFDLTWAPPPEIY